MSAGDTFYLVTSTFEYFPGVPVYKSKNLVNWEMAGHCLTRESQLNLKNSAVSGGIYAPTIRYYDGMFYMITTNVSDKGSFLVYTDDVSKEWSEPVWLSRGGIDPSLLFADGTVYYVSNEDSHGNHGIYLNEIDPKTGANLTEEVLISKGCVGRFPEAPHLYKIGEIYYLLLAEGGTEYGHMVTIQRSHCPYGPYEPCPYNPILSHRYKEDMRIMCTGHGDLIEDLDGNWWMTVLGVRTLSDETHMSMLHHLGRETFLAKVEWENGWPIVGNQGTLDFVMEAALPNGESVKKICSEYGLDTTWDPEYFSKEYLYLRNPDKENYQYEKESDCLYLKGNGIGLSAQTGSPTFLAVRQKEFVTEAKVHCELTEVHGCCGMTVFYNCEHHYDLCLMEEHGKYYAMVRKQIYDLQAVTEKIELSANTAVLKICSDKDYYYFYAGETEETMQYLGKGTTAAMCTEITRHMTFTGTLLGIFCEDGVGRMGKLRYRQCL